MFGKRKSKLGVSEEPAGQDQDETVVLDDAVTEDEAQPITAEVPEVGPEKMPESVGSLGGLRGLSPTAIPAPGHPTGGILSPK